MKLEYRREGGGWGESLLAVSSPASKICSISCLSSSYSSVLSRSGFRITPFSPVLLDLEREKKGPPEAIFAERGKKEWKEGGKRGAWIV